MKPKHHEIKLEDLELWISEDTLFAFSIREDKRLTCSVNGTIKVSVHGKIVYQGIYTSLAVESYNSITEEYVDKQINI